MNSQEGEESKGPRLPPEDGGSEGHGSTSASFETYLVRNESWDSAMESGEAKNESNFIMAA